MAHPSNYSLELRTRAVRMVAELAPDYPTQYAAITGGAEAGHRHGGDAAQIGAPLGPGRCTIT
jgi:hypothetical protein